MESKEAALVQKEGFVYYNYLEYSKVINHTCIYILIFISLFKWQLHKWSKFCKRKHTPDTKDLHSKNVFNVFYCPAWRPHQIYSIWIAVSLVLYFTYSNPPGTKQLQGPEANSSAAWKLGCNYLYFYGDYLCFYVFKYLTQNDPMFSTSCSSRRACF